MTTTKIVFSVVISAGLSLLLSGQNPGILNEARAGNASSAPTGAMAIQRPDFSGTWVFNPAKSKMGIPVPDSCIFRIDHQEPAFHLARTIVRKGKSDDWSIDLTTDGRVVISESDSDTTAGRLFWDGDALVFDSKITIPGRVAANVVRYELSADGKTLTATEAFRGPVVKYDNVWVFDKR